MYFNKSFPEKCNFRQENRHANIITANTPKPIIIFFTLPVW